MNSRSSQVEHLVPVRGETRAPPFSITLFIVLTHVLILLTPLVTQLINHQPRSLAWTLPPTSRPIDVTTYSFPPPTFQLAEIEFLIYIGSLSSVPTGDPHTQARTLEAILGLLPLSTAIITKHVPIYPQLSPEFLPLLLNGDSVQSR